MTPGYLADSTLESGRLDLHTAPGVTPTGWVDHPELFSGFVVRPDVAAAGILAVADVAATRYADVGLAKRLANLDPVVTASGDRLRFESFSACNGVHARFDLLPDGIESGEVRFGTTNVDVSAPLRQALAGVSRTTPLHVAVGNDELRVSTPWTTNVEERVLLPERWVRGFAETPQVARSMRPVAQLDGRAAAAFLGSLPRVADPGVDLHWRSVGERLLPTLSSGPGVVSIAGSRRIRAAARLVRFATRLSISTDELGRSAWVFHVPGGRLTLLLTAAAYRGFSGLGSLLTYLTHPDSEHVGRRILALLAWDAVIDLDALAVGLATDPAHVELGLGWLAATGRVGFDIADQTWFHRDLPVDAEAVLRRNPRLVSARRLLENHGVTARATSWSVAGSGSQRYAVTRQTDGALGCTCRWEDDRRAGWGPCKHVLAVALSTHEVGEASAD